jgi:hypothetical protein
MKNETKWVVTKCSSVYRLLPDGYLLSLLFDPDDGGSKFFRNVVELLMDYTITHKTLPFIVSAVRTSNPILHIVDVVFYIRHNESSSNYSTNNSPNYVFIYISMVLQFFC